MPVPGKVAPPRGILVLPFVCVPPDPEMEYFVDGLTDELITDLSGVEALRVISRTSAMQLKGTEKTIPVIGRELRVQFVLEGTVRIHGKSLRINAKLVDAARDCNVWAEKLGGTLEDVLEIEESLSRKIVQALKVRLSPGEEQRLSQRPIRDPRAYEFYLRARQEILQYSEEALDRALRYLEEAARITGENVQILAARGYAYWQYLNAGVSADPTLLTRARDCAERILTLEPDSPHGHRLLGLISITDGNLQQVVRHLKISLARDPNDSDTLAWLLVGYALAGRPAAATPIVERLLRIDPLTPLYQCLPGHLAVMGGDFQRALSSFERGFRMEPTNPMVRLKYAQALTLAGRREQAVDLLAPLADNGDASLFGQVARFYSRALEGRSEEALEAMSEEALAAARQDMEYSWMLAECYALAGEVEEAVGWIANAKAHGFLNFPLLAEHDPLLADLRGNERFQTLLEEMRRPWEAFEP
jgi:non-specific serine/threonine protein kinase